MNCDKELKKTPLVCTLKSGHKGNHKAYGKVFGAIIPRRYLIAEWSRKIVYLDEAWK